MKKKFLKPIVLPALRGIMGDWVYYTCLIDFRELSERVQYAEEVHKNKLLSQMIQRRLKQGRAKQIAQYLIDQRERFFNALVVATYEGQPNWYALNEVKSKIETNESIEPDKETIASVGFLALQGNEKLFALDGQHRLAGIKKVVENANKKDMNQDLSNDEVSVIFVGHKCTEEGFKRTRRLFTTLNKTARPVSKGDIIALDEDDTMSICVRRLIEDTDLFEGERIAYVASGNMPSSNKTSLTTIANLYDVLTILFCTAESELKKSKSDLQRVRLDDNDLDKYFKFALKYFLLLRKNFAALEDFFGSDNTELVVKKYRNNKGGHILFRPIGLEIMTLVIARFTKNNMELSDAINLAAKLPSNLVEIPFLNLIWDPNKENMINRYKATTREVLLYMAGMNSEKYPESILLEKYRREIDDPLAQLPEKI